MSFFVPDGRVYRSALKMPSTIPTPGTFTPVGSVKPWKAAETKYDLKQAKKNPPQDWMLLNGAPLSPFKNFKLFSKLGYRFGHDGLKFRLPDWRGTGLGEAFKPGDKIFNPGPSYIYVLYVMKVK